MTDHAANWLTDAEWETAQRSLPILCVEAVLIRSLAGRVEVGLIERDNPFGPDPVWCQIGGRVRRDELLTSAVRRHLADAVDGVELPAGAADLQPVYAMQFMPDGPTAEAPWLGVDPRKHSVSLCFAIPVDAGPTWRPGGEALAFEWFAATELRRLPQIWPGTGHLVGEVLARTEFAP